MARVNERLGSWVPPRELEDIGLENTQQSDPYGDETQHEQTFPELAEVLEPTSEVGYHHRRVDILLPREDQIAGDHVVVWSHDANGNVMGRALKIQFWIVGHIKLSLLEARLQN